MYTWLKQFLQGAWLSNTFEHLVHSVLTSQSLCVDFPVESFGALSSNTFEHLVHSVLTS